MLFEWRLINDLINYPILSSILTVFTSGWQEVRKLQVFRAQCDVFKRQLQELQVKVVDETKRADKAAFEAKRSTDKLTTLQREKDVSFYAYDWHWA